MPNLLTVKEVAARLGITTVRVRALIESGRLPATKFADRWQISEKALTRFSPRPVGRPRTKGE